MPVVRTRIASAVAMPMEEPIERIRFHIEAPSVRCTGAKVAKVRTPRGPMMEPAPMPCIRPVQNTAEAATSRFHFDIH